MEEVGGVNLAEFSGDLFQGAAGAVVYPAPRGPEDRIELVDASRIGAHSLTVWSHVGAPQESDGRGKLPQRLV